MKTERFNVQACCGSTTLMLKTDQPLTLEFIHFLVSKNYKEQKHFTKAGIVYAETDKIVVSGSIGKNNLNVRCKVKDCHNYIGDFEELIKDWQ